MDKKELKSLLAAWENIELTMVEIINNPQHLDILMSMALHDTDKMSWRAAYLADKIHDEAPELVLPYLKDMILQLKVEKSTSKKRHYLKLTAMNKVPEEFQGFLVDYCLHALQSDKEPPAVRVHAMQVLYNISEDEPDLKPEFLAVIEHEMKYHATAGIKSRGSKLAQKLRNQIS